MTASLLPKTWRYRIFGVTWLSYAGFYLCRKNFSVVMPMLTDEFGFTKVDLALILTGYSLIYQYSVQFGSMIYHLVPDGLVTHGLIRAQ